MQLLSRLFALTVLSLGLAMPALAQSGNVEVTADQFLVDENKSEASFVGNAVIKQPGITIKADKVVVSYGPGGASDLKEFIATGNVRLEQPDQTATADRGVYDPKTRIMRLTGNVVVSNATGTVRGPELVVNMATGLSEFSAQPGGRVTGVFSTDGVGQ